MRCAHPLPRACGGWRRKEGTGWLSSQQPAKAQLPAETQTAEEGSPDLTAQEGEESGGCSLAIRVQACEQVTTEQNRIVCRDQACPRARVLSSLTCEVDDINGRRRHHQVQLQQGRGAGGARLRWLRRK